MQVLPTFTAEEAPKTPIFETEDNGQSGMIEIVLPFEEDLEDEQYTWNIGKALGLKCNNERAMLEGLAKVKECKDFSLPRRRRRQKKSKGCS